MRSDTLELERLLTSALVSSIKALTVRMDRLDKKVERLKAAIEGEPVPALHRRRPPTAKKGQARRHPLMRAGSSRIRRGRSPATAAPARSPRTRPSPVVGNGNSIVRRIDAGAALRRIVAEASSVDCHRRYQDARLPDRC